MTPRPSVRAEGHRAPSTTWCSRPFSVLLLTSLLLNAGCLGRTTNSNPIPVLSVNEFAACRSARPNPIDVYQFQIHVRPPDQVTSAVAETEPDTATTLCLLDKLKRLRHPVKKPTELRLFVDFPASGGVHVRMEEL